MTLVFFFIRKFINKYFTNNNLELTDINHHITNHPCTNRYQKNKHKQVLALKSVYNKALEGGAESF